MKEKEKIIPVLLGADLCCYSLARAFYLAYGCRSYAFGKMRLGATSHCHFIKFCEVPRLGEREVLLDTLERFAVKHKGKRILFPCTDEYVSLLSAEKERLSAVYTVMAPEASLFRMLGTKDAFYSLCDRYGIPYPKTRVIQLPAETREFRENLPFTYPAVMKAGNSIAYFKHPFPDMQKVYTVNTPEEAESIAKKWESAGYGGTVILQEKIPGGEEHEHVVTFYCDRNARVRTVASARVLLGERTPKGRGNHAALLTETPFPIAEKLARMMESLGYRGFCHFDLKTDPRDGKLYVFEVNQRLGRSHLYLSAAGENPAETVVRDRILNENLEKKTVGAYPVFFYTVPKRAVYRYTNDKYAVAEARRLDRIGRSYSSGPLLSERLRRPLRWIYAWFHNFREMRKFRVGGVL